MLTLYRAGFNRRLIGLTRWALGPKSTQKETSVVSRLDVSHGSTPSRCDNGRGIAITQGPASAPPAQTPPVPPPARFFNG